MKRFSKKQGFTLIELLVVISIIAILISIATPALTRALKRAAMTKTLNNARQIKLALDQFAMDNDGQYPNENTAENYNVSANDSAISAFQQLIEAGLLDDEKIFYVKENPNVKSTPPDGDGLIEAGECGFGYVSGLSNTSEGKFPIIFDAVGKGITSNPQFSLKTWDRKAIIVRVDGSVKPEIISASKNAEKGQVKGKIARGGSSKTISIFSQGENGYLPEDVKIYGGGK